MQCADDFSRNASFIHDHSGKIHFLRSGYGTEYNSRKSTTMDNLIQVRRKLESPVSTKEQTMDITWVRSASSESQYNEESEEQSQSVKESQRNHSGAKLSIGSESDLQLRELPYGLNSRCSIASRGDSFSRQSSINENEFHPQELLTPAFENSVEDGVKSQMSSHHHEHDALSQISEEEYLGEPGAKDKEQSADCLYSNDAAPKNNPTHPADTLNFPPLVSRQINQKEILLKANTIHSLISLRRRLNQAYSLKNSEVIKRSITVDYTDYMISLK